MASPTSDVALLTEHFGYPPVSLIDEIINNINQLADRALGSVEQKLLEQPPSTIGFKPSSARLPPPSKQPPSRSSSRNNNATSAAAASKDGPDPSIALSPEEAARHEIENGTHQLETLLCSSIDRNFDKFELYVMQNILCIRPSEPREWIRLGHYEGLDLEGVASPPGGAEEEDGGRPSVGGVRRLRRRLQASQQLNAMLHAEKARNEALLEALRAVVGVPPGAEKEKSVQERKQKLSAEPKMELDDDEVDVSAGARPPFGFLRNAGGLAAGAAEKPLETTTAFTLSQLQALRALSTSLRNIMPDLERAREEGEHDGARKSWRRERMEYVETATRKHLEHARGLELGKGGEVRDGEWQREGRKLAADEVEGLEKVVALLGDAGPAGPAGGGEGGEMDES